MNTINNLDVARLGRDGRLREVAAALAAGLLRARAKGMAPTLSGCTESEFGLGFSGEQRVHANPSMTNGERA
jgi:hypothetical protein